MSEAKGINSLARALQGRIREVGAKSPVLDFGEIQEDMSLKTNYFPLPIPQQDYMVCRSVAWGAIDDIFYKTQYTGIVNSGEHMHGTNGEHGAHVSGNGMHSHAKDANEMQHVHDMLIGPKYRWLMPGDRVLVAWVGDDACVVDLVVPATIIER